MPVIHIETQPSAANAYEFIQTWIDDHGGNVDERTYNESHSDRMYAAMTNLGYACKWLSDGLAVRGAICIVTDTDGKDVRYSGEHDDLYEAIRSRPDYQKNRIKYGLIYGKYLGYLDRIRELADENEITFTQNADVMLGVVNRGREFVDTLAPRVANPKYWKRDNLLVLSMKGRHNTVMCRICGKSIMYNQTDEFAPYSVWSDDGKRTKMIKSDKQAVAWFLESHCRIHGVKE